MAPSPDKPMLMGDEVEYSVSARNADGERISPEVACYWLFEEAREQLAWLPDCYHPTQGVYLANGARFYPEINGTPEYGTPECRTPRELAAHEKAAECLLRQLAQHVSLRRRAAVTVTKSNLDFVQGDVFTKGNHESYTSWAPLARMIDQLLPHLASRTFYAGAGCLSARPGGGGFELSQRARHITRAVGSETTFDRALFCNRIRKATDRGFNREAWTRIHLISKDSHRSPFNIYLVGTTALLVHLLNHGHRVWDRAALADPLQALHAFSFDPDLRVRVPLTDGAMLSALGVQEEYLAACERPAARADWPDWAPELVGRWRATLEQARRDPRRLSDRLDAYAKLQLFEQLLAQAQTSWRELHAAFGRLNRLHHENSERLVKAVLRGDPAGIPAARRAAYDEISRELDAAGPRAREHLDLAVRLQWLDLKYHELGGLYDDLHQQGLVDGVVLSEADVTRAMNEPPPGGRAAARGRLIRDQQHDRNEWLCNWDHVRHAASGRTFVLTDPFSGRIERHDSTVAAGSTTDRPGASRS